MTNKTISTSDILLVFIPMWSSINLLSNYTFLSSYYIITILKLIFGLITVRLICLFVIINGHYSKSDFIKAIIIISIAEIVRFFSGSDFFTVLLYVIAAGKYIESDSLIKRIVIYNLVAVIITIICSLLGIINSNVLLESGRVRYSFGFYHPNTLATIIFSFIITFWVYDNRKHISIIISFFAFLFTFFLCDSRTASFLILLCFCIQSILFVINKYKSLSVKIMHRIVRIGCIISFIGIVGSFFVIDSKFGTDNLNDILSGRITQIRAYYDYYGISFLGQKLDMGYHVYKYGLSTLDNSYVHLLLGFGIPFFISYLIYYIKLIKLQYNKGKIEKVFLLVLYLIYGFFETVAIRIDFNSSLLLFNEVIWNDDKSRRIKVIDYDK